MSKSSPQMVLFATLTHLILRMHNASMWDYFLIPSAYPASNIERNPPLSEIPEENTRCLVFCYLASSATNSSKCSATNNLRSHILNNKCITFNFRRGKKPPFVKYLILPHLDITQRGNPPQGSNMEIRSVISKEPVVQQIQYDFFFVLVKKMSKLFLLSLIVFHICYKNSTLIVCKIISSMGCL